MAGRIHRMAPVHPRHHGRQGRVRDPPCVAIVPNAPQAPGCGSGSRPPGGRPLLGSSRAGVPLVGTDERARGGEASPPPTLIASPRNNALTSSPESVSYSSSALAIVWRSSRCSVRIRRADPSPSSIRRRISSSISLAVASETFLRWVTEWPRKTSSSLSLYLIGPSFSDMPIPSPCGAPSTSPAGCRWRRRS